MPQTAPAENTEIVTTEEYLRRERLADHRSEYQDGRIVAMSGASDSHGVIALNIGSAIRPHIRGGGCRAYLADMKVRLVGSFRYVYPDIVVVCGPPQFEDERTDIVANPTLIIEILSPSTALVDRGTKWEGYRRVPSLVEYVLVAQDHAFVEQFLRQGDLWLYRATDSLDAAITLDSIGLTLPMTAVYEDVSLALDAGT